MKAMKRASRTASVPDILDTRAAAKYLGCSTQFLEILRCKGGGPPFAKLGGLVRYRRSSLEAWVASSEITSTSERPCAPTQR